MNRSENSDHPEHPSGNEPFSDLWNARQLVARYGKDIRYVPSWAQWIAWDGMRWLTDVDGEVIRRAKETVDFLQDRVTQTEEDTHE